MPGHEYSPSEALKVLLAKLEANAELAARVKAAIDAGTDKQEAEVASGRGRRKRGRVYRKHIAYTDQQALDVALSVLRAHFFELPQIVNTAADDFKDSRIGTGETGRGYGSPPRTARPARDLVDLMGEDKPFEIEIETEATLTKSNAPTQHLKRYEPGLIDQVGKLIEALQDHLTFGAPRGDTSGS